MKNLNNALPKLADSDISEIRYNKDSLLESLTKDIRRPTKSWKVFFLFPYSSLLRFVLLLTVAIVTLSFVLTFSFIYIKDILLFRSNLSVNNKGVFMPSKSCGREYCLFLFNSSDLWANTGICLNEGDEYKMSVSGAFHSSAGHFCIDADKNNSDSEVIWIGGKMRKEYSDNENITSKQQEKMPYCVKPKAHLGAILYRIAPEYQLWNPKVDNKKDSIHIWKPIIGNEFNKVETSGVLTMAVNDIYFNSVEYLDNYIAKFPIRIDSILCRDSIIKRDQGKGMYKKMFYDDNIGQILVCLEIQHPLPGGFFNPLSAFRNLETQTELKSEKINNKWLFKLSIMPSFFCFISHIFVIFIVYIAATLVIIYLLFLLGYWVIKGIKELVCLQKKETAANNTSNS